MLPMTECMWSVLCNSVGGFEGSRSSTLCKSVCTDVISVGVL